MAAPAEVWVTWVPGCWNTADAVGGAGITTVLGDASVPTHSQTTWDIPDQRTSVVLKGPKPHLCQRPFCSHLQSEHLATTCSEHTCPDRQGQHNNYDEG